VSSLTSEQARAYLERWELVRAAEAAELQRTPMQTKLLQLAAPMQSREVFGTDPGREAESAKVHELWGADQAGDECLRRCLRRFWKTSRDCWRLIPTQMLQLPDAGSASSRLQRLCRTSWTSSTELLRDSRLGA